MPADARRSGPAACAAERTRSSVVAAGSPWRRRRSGTRRPPPRPRGATAASAAPPRRARRAPPPAPAATRCRAMWTPLDEHLVGQQRAGADARALERDQAQLGVALLGDRVHVRDAQLQVRRREHQRGEHERGAERRHPAPAHDQVRPAGPRAAGLVVVAHVRPVQARAELARARPAAGSSRRAR